MDRYIRTIIVSWVSFTLCKFSITIGKLANASSFTLTIQQVY